MAAKAPFILAIDQGTTSSRAIVFDADLAIVASAQQEFPQHYPQSGWVEHEPDDLWSTTLTTLCEAVAKAGLEASQIAAIGITNQRETTIVWDHETGKPVHRAIVWQDRRTAEVCQRMRADGAQNGHARADHINAAIAAYQKATTTDPNDLEARWKLLRSLRFKGAYVASTNGEKRQVYSQAKLAGENALKVVDRQLAPKGINSVSKATEKQIADVSKAIPGVPEIFLWDAINWGEWALAYGKMAAVREGAADRIRREATIANLVDPRLEGGSPSRVLGRLHDQTPRRACRTPMPTHPS